MTSVLPRISRGSRVQDIHSAPTSLPSLTSIDSAFQLQEYIALLIHSDAHDVKRIINIPTRDDDEHGALASSSLSPSSEEGKQSEESAAGPSEYAADEHCWVYEQIRRVAQDLSHPLLSSLQLECNRHTCPEMKADEWLYLCVAHGTGQSGIIEQQCCAIDYIVHTLDSAIALLNSPKAFPSRISIPNASRRHFNSLARRLSRIFAHAYYHHRGAFEQCEAESSLYSRFYHLSRTFDLVPAEFLIPPPPSQAEAAAQDALNEDAAFDRRSSSHSLPRPDASTLPSPKPPPFVPSDSAIADDDLNISSSRNRSDNVLLSTDSLHGDKSAWEHSALSSRSSSGSNPAVNEDALDAVDDDGYDIVEGLSAQGLGEMMQSIEDEDEQDQEQAEEGRGVVVDEVDGAEEALPPIADASSPRHSALEDLNMVHAVESASVLPILSAHSVLSPREESSAVSQALSSSPLRSPHRRSNTLRQSDVSPSLLTRELPDDEEPAPLSLGLLPPKRTSSEHPSIQTIATALASSVGEPSVTETEAIHGDEMEAPRDMDEIDLSSGPSVGSDDEEPELVSEFESNGEGEKSRSH